MSSAVVEHSVETEKFHLPALPEDHLQIEFLEGDDEDDLSIPDQYPFAASQVFTETVAAAEKLTVGEDVKKIYCLTITGKDFPYQPGDTIGILPENSEEEIDKILAQLNIKHVASKICKISQKPGVSKKLTNKPAFLNRKTTLELIFKTCLDVRCLPKKLLIRILAEHTKDPGERKVLQELCSREGSSKYLSQMIEKRTTFLDLFLKLPSCCPPVCTLLQHLPKLLPRPYSIASSCLVSPDKFNIVFSVVKHADGLSKEGLCTGMLEKIANRINNNIYNENSVKMFFRKSNSFNLPADSKVPLILVAPGTGIAPFMSFLQHRKALNTSGQTFGQAWLFYGCRYQDKDFLFKKELQEFVNAGILTEFHVAFSRQGQDVKYVQDNIRKFGKEVSELLFEKEAVMYVCGDARNMRKDIFDSVVEVVEKHRKMSNSEAIEAVKQLQQRKVYLEDIWI